jgi:hypothetical protein
MPFDEKEIMFAISQLPSDSAPGPDGFTGIFFKKCWHIIRGDIMEAINSFHNLRTGDLNLINKANVALIPKKERAESVSNFCPISPIHAIAKS